MIYIYMSVYIVCAHKWLDCMASVALTMFLGLHSAMRSANLVCSASLLVARRHFRAERWEEQRPGQCFLVLMAIYCVVYEAVKDRLKALTRAGNPQPLDTYESLPTHAEKRVLASK